MPPLDPTVASILDQPTSTTHKTDNDSSSELDEDELLSSLETADLSHLREQRIQQLSEELSRASALKASGTGTYTTITSRNSPASTSYPEGDPNQNVLNITTSHERAIVHFFKTDFARCRIMDSHLEKLAERHYEVRFARVDVGEVPFLVEKLKVRVLPCVIAFVKGVAVDRVIGFEGLNGDRFKTGELEARLVGKGVLVRSKVDDTGPYQAAGKMARRSEDVEEEDEGDDWD